MIETPRSTVPTPVVVVSFDMPFWVLVGFLVKLAIAAIPAAIILSLVWWAVLSLIYLIFGTHLGSGYGIH